MRNRSRIGRISPSVQRCKELSRVLQRAGMPDFMACLPLSLLSLQHCLILRRKTARIAVIEGRMQRWLATVRDMSAHERARSEFLDLDHSMRNDIVGARDSMRDLCELCSEICGSFAVIGHESDLLERYRQRFVDVVARACVLSDTLVDAIDAHDRCALDIRQQQHALEQAALASAAAHAARG